LRKGLAIDLEWRRAKAAGSIVVLVPAQLESVSGFDEANIFLGGPAIQIVRQHVGHAGRSEVRITPALRQGVL